MKTFYLQQYWPQEGWRKGTSSGLGSLWIQNMAGSGPVKILSVIWTGTQVIDTGLQRWARQGYG